MAISLGAGTLVPRLGLASFRRRILFRGAFLLLILATLALALVLLKEEKQRSYDNYRTGFQKTRAEILARLRHPAGQLALLNPSLRNTGMTPLRPLVLPYAGIDFDDQSKAQQAVEMAGCAVRYRDGGSLCAAIGNSPYAGGFLYLVGTFLSGDLVPRPRGALDLSQVHYARVAVTVRDESTRWVAPFEAIAGASGPPRRGRLTGFADTGPSLTADARPVRDFRGWLWQADQCAVEGATGAECAKRSFFSIRLPVEAFREAIFAKPSPIWPPQDLDQVRVHVEVLGPHSEQPLFDSNATGATAPPSLDDVTLTLLPGETLLIRKIADGTKELVRRQGVDEAVEPSLPWLPGLIRRLPVDGYDAPIEAKEIIATPAGSYEVTLAGDVRSVDRRLAVVATRLSWFVGAMLGAVALAWLVIEVGLIRRIAVLTKRAAAVSYNVQDAQVDRRIGDIDVSDLRGRDELGILAGSLADLLERVKDDVKREHVRAAQERDMWQAVGHEIMSPLQSLMVLHPEGSDPSHRYVQRMQEAVRILYGTASPSEALQAATVALGAIDLDAFLHNIATNAPFAGIRDVIYQRTSRTVMARADEYRLEDAVTHVLGNADRYRRAGTSIVLRLVAATSTATIEIYNEGGAIDPALIDRVFDYGISDSESASGGKHRGQGLFVARTYMAKMGGTIGVRNEKDGVTFSLTLQRVSS